MELNPRKRMKAFWLFLILILPLKVWAATLTNPIADVTNLPALLERIANFFFTISLYLVPLLIVIAGVFFVTAAGDPNQIEKGKKILTYTLIGFIIILAARGLIALFQQIL